MKYFFFILLIPAFLFTSDFGSNKIYSLAQSGDHKELVKLFDNAPHLSIFQGNILLNNLAKKVKKKFGMELEANLFKELIGEIVSNEKATDYKKEVILSFFEQALDLCPKDTVKKSSDFGFLKNTPVLGIGIHRVPAFANEVEISSGVVLGAIETLAGALLWLTPLRPVGTGLMIDGVRRMLNAVDESPPPDLNPSNSASIQN